jgi:hypothetical protein
VDHAFAGEVGIFGRVATGTDRNPPWSALASRSRVPPYACVAVPRSYRCPPCSAPAHSCRPGSCAGCRTACTRPWRRARRFWPSPRARYPRSACRCPRYPLLPLESPC